MSKYEINVEEILPDIQELIEKENKGALLNILVDLHPADIAQIIPSLKQEERNYIIHLLPHDRASEVLAELDPPIKEKILKDFSEQEISDIVSEMDSDDAADFIAELPDEMAEKVLEQVEEEVSEDVKELLLYKEDTAGGIMALEYLALPANATVNDAIELLRKNREEVENVYNIWVVDEHNRLVGSVSLKDLVLASGTTRLREIMDVDVKYVYPDMDQEEVAKMFRKYDLISVPVVNRQKQIVGRITVDDIVDVIEEEVSEDLALLAGSSDEEIMEESSFRISRARIPWLMVAFVGEIISALILDNFSATLNQKVMTAFFIPIIMAMGGSSGQQSSIIVIRGLATGDISLRDTRKRLWKEFKVSLINSILFSSMIFLLAYMWDELYFAIILALSMFLVINNATVVGALTPLVFKKFKIDPALASAPFVSVSNDIVGLLIYLTTTTVMLSIVY